MLAKRLLVTIILLPVGLAIIWLGGVAYTITIALILCLAAWEYSRLFRAVGLQPASVLLISGVLLLTIGRAWNGFESAPWMLSLLTLAAMGYHLLAYERGQEQPGTNFAVTLAGIFYLGWIGAYLISLRSLPQGVWWFLLVLPSVWIADSGAYMIGRSLGRHKLCPRLSPKKTWEGYIAGIITGTLGAALLASLWRISAGPETAITTGNGALLGLILSVTTTLGDLGESMIKRQAGIKDSSHLIPGHGGVFDRIDSWLWAGVIGYYVIVWLFL